MPTLLVTGGAGFIGGYTARMAIDLGWDVRILDNLSTGSNSTVQALEAMGAMVITGDVCDEATVNGAVNGCHAIAHFAAQTSVPRSMEHPEETIEVNVGGTSTIIKACQAHGVKRFVMASSAAVYGTRDEFPLGEHHAGTFHSPYADSKWQNEHQVLEAKEAGMEAVALRFFNVYGAGQQSDGAYAAVVPKFIQLALAGQAATIFGNGLQTRDFVHVSDAANAVLMMATQPWDGERAHVYNVCTETECSLLDLMREIHLVLEEVAPHVARHAPNHGPERAGDIARSIGSNANLCSDTEWAPTVGFSEGLRQQILNALQGA
jgi:nucleoside-diphosphate-sugar epimerase